MAPREQRDACVDHIRGPSEATQRTGGARFVQVEIPNVKHTGLQKADQTHLPRAIAPDLADHSSRHVNGHAMFRCELDQATHTPIITLERDQRTSVEDYRPRA
jgi:hypothetical protein